MAQHLPNPGIFREYDIRGIIDETLFYDDAFYIGKAFASKVLSQNANKTIAVCYDGRISSPALKEKLVEGIESTGADVINIGIGPTPILYFAVMSLNLGGGVMITGSHNPKNHNGFKFMLGKKSLFGEGIKELAGIIEKNLYPQGSGQQNDLDISEKYIDELVKAFGNNSGDIKIAWDAGNGATGEIMARLTKKLPGKHVLLNEEIDGNFPSHHPDPSEPKNMQQLIEAVRKENCDLGVAFDGDGDRVGAVDSKGRIISGDQLISIYAGEVLSKNIGATIIADIKTSKYVFDYIKSLGGKPIMWKAGHSLIKSKMAETGAVFAGEMSGHIFFADEYYGFDDGLYAAVRLARIAATEKSFISKFIDDFPVMHNTPEIRFFCADDKKFKVIENIRNRLLESKRRFSDIDGVRVETVDGWWLLRASNTQAALTARCEAKDQAGLDNLKKELAKELALENLQIDFNQASGH